MNYYLSKLISSLLFIVTVGSVYADLGVGTDTVTYHVNESMSFIVNTSEANMTISKGDDILVHLGDRAVFRSTQKKVAFIPLQSSVPDCISKNTLKVVSFGLPKIYRPDSILYLSSGYANKRIESSYQVSVLHELQEEACLAEVERLYRWPRDELYTEENTYICGM